MRRSVSVLLLVCLTVTMLFSVTGSAAANDEYGFISSTRSVLYSDAAMTKKVKNLSRYDIVLISGTSGSCLQVKVNGGSGYVAVRDVTAVTNLGRTAKVSKAAKVYASPSTSAKKASVAKGTQVNLIAYSGSWAMVERSGVFAYILKSNLTEATAPAPTDAAKNTPAPGSSNTLLTGNVVECSFTAKVNVKMLSFYSRPTASSSYRISYLYSGNAVTVLAYNASWAYVSYNGKTGYCQRAYLKKVANVTPTPIPQVDLIKPCTPFTAVVSQSKVYVYERPDASSTCLGYIVKGIGVQVIGYGDTWAQITLGSRTGYACKSNFNLPAPTPVVTPTPTPAPTRPPYVSSDEIFKDKNTTNEQKAYLYLSRETDYNSAVACGIMASINQESRFNPESGKGKSYQGICQWSSSRFSLLTTWCSQNGYDPYSLEGQLKFLYYDLSQRYTVYHKALLAIENTAEGAYEAGYYFCYHYERPASLESSSQKRGTAARDTYWAKYGE